MRKANQIRVASLVILVLACSLAASAQVELGATTLNLDGNLGFGYSAGFGNGDVLSNHSQGISGNANLTGYYFHPNFLSFEFRPYFQRDQSNSESQILTKSSGFGGGVNFFNGSHFPGSVSFGKDFSSNSEFRLAGLPSITGDSSGQNFAISWSALVPNYPQLRASYTIGSSKSSVDGIISENESNSKNLLLSSNYQLKGFSLAGNFSHNNSHFTSDAVLLPTPISSGGSSSMYSVTASHALPLSGGLSMGWSHSGSEMEQGTKYASDSYTVGAGFLPWRRVSVNQTLTYTTDLSAYLAQSIVGEGSVPLLHPDFESNSLNLGTNVSVAIGHGFNVNGHMNHRRQTFAGQDFTDTQFGGTLNYNFRSPLFGFLYFGFGMVDTASKTGNDGAGIVANLGMSRKFGHWDTSADFNYQQNVQTQIILATTSSYSYGGTIRRRFNQETSWGASYRGSHSGLTTQDGNGSRSETYGSQFSWRRYAFSGNYSKSTGTAVLSSNGTLTSTPLGSLFTDDVIYLNASSYSFTVSTRLFRRVTVTGGYVNVFSSTAQGNAGTVNSGERYNARLEYRLRKFAIIGGFNRSSQALSAVPGDPRVVNSYYISLSRWFNVF